VQGKLYIRGIPQLLIVALLLFPIAYFTDKYIEACFQIVALFALRYKFEKTYHASTTMRCTFLTLSIGYLAIPRILPLSLVLFSSVFIGFLIAFLSWLAQEFIDRQKKITRLEKESQSREFSLYDCNKDEFTAYCLSKKVRRDRVEYVWDILRSDTSVVDLADKYYVEPQTIKQDRWRYKKKLLAIDIKNTIDK
jgi:hypothetical protein